MTGASDIGLEDGGAVLGRLVGDREGLIVGFIVVGFKDGRNDGFLDGTAAYVLQRKIPTNFEFRQTLSGNGINKKGENLHGTYQLKIIL